MSAHHPAKLTGLAADVTDQKLLQTVALIDRLPERGAVDDLLAPLRPRLQRLKPPRPLSLRRVLTFPLEELLVAAADWRPGTQRLSRELLGAIHQIVLDGLALERQAAVERMVAGHTMNDKVVVHRAGQEIWPEAATILRAALPPDAANGDNKGRNRRQQLALAAELFAIGGQLAGVFLSLPAKPVRRLDDGQKERIGKLLRLLEGMGGQALALGGEALGERLDDPGMLLEVLQRSSDGDASALRLAAAAAASRRVMAELDATVEQLRRAGRQPAVVLAGEIVELVGSLSALEAAPADLPVDRVQLKQVARKAAKAVEGHLQAVVTGEVLDGFKALATPENGDDAIAAIEAAARAARKLAAAGRQLGVGGQVDLIVKSGFDAFRRSLGPPGNSDHDEAQVMDQLRIVEIVFGPEAAAELLTARLMESKH